MVSKKERVVNTREIFPENKGKQAPDRSIGRAPDNFCRRFALGKIWILAYVLNYLLRDFNPVGAVKNFRICAVRSYFADNEIIILFYLKHGYGHVFVKKRGKVTAEFFWGKRPEYYIQKMM